MITRIRIKLGAATVFDVGEREAFKLGSTHYPADWFIRGGTIPGHTIEPYDATPPPLPTPDPRATGAQMIDEAKARNKLAALLGVLDASERAVFYTRRQITAGSGIAETLRARLGISALAMEGFIAAAAVRSEEV